MTPEPEVWVVVASHDGVSQPDGPLVMETYTRNATREEAMKRATSYERRYGACRIARLVFDDQPETSK